LAAAPVGAAALVAPALAARAAGPTLVTVLTRSLRRLRGLLGGFRIDHVERARRRLGGAMARREIAAVHLVGVVTPIGVGAAVLAAGRVARCVLFAAVALLKLLLTAHHTEVML